MKTLALRALATFGIIVVLLSVHVWRNYSTCYAPNKTIERYLVEEIPLGSPLSEVKTWISGKRGLSYESRSGGFNRRFDRRSSSPLVVTTVKAKLGSCAVPLKRTTVAYWGFDSDDRLVEVYVDSTVDGI